MKILLVEDEPEFAAIVQQGLEEARYKVDLAYDGRTGLRLALEEAYGLIILDVMLPDQEGWSICQRLRARRDPVPILLLTARDTVQDRVRGLEAGADDYMAKPFDFRELLARVRALARRDKVHKSCTIRIADLEIDTNLREVRRAGQSITLTDREYTLLEALASREGKVVPREVITNYVWADLDSYSNTVDAFVYLLRKKIDAGHAVKLIETVRQSGYRLRDPANPSGDPS